MRGPEGRVDVSSPRIRPETVRAIAHDIGFDLVRFGPADPGEHGARFVDWIEQGRHAERVSKTSGIYLAAVLEYVTAEMLEIAGECCVDGGMKRIMPRHINLGLRSDEEFAKLLRSVVIS